MRYITFLLLLLPLAVSAQTTNQKLLDYFTAHHGGAVIKKYSDWKKFGTDSIGNPKGVFISTEDAIEAIVRRAQERGGGEAFDIAYIAKELGTDWKATDTLVRFYIPAQYLDSPLRLRLPDKNSAGVNDKFIPGGRIISGFNEGYVNQIPIALTRGVPNYFDSSDKYEILIPSTKIMTNTATDDDDEPKVSKTSIMLMALLPALLFVMFVWIFLKGMKNINLNDMLSENNASKVTIMNPAYTPENLAKWVASSGAQGDQAAYNAAKAAADTAKQELDTAQQAYDANNTDTTLKQTLDQKQQAYNDAKTKLSAVPTGSLSPAIISNLTNLFPATIDVSQDSHAVYRPSASRLIAFLSGILLLIVVLCMTCFYIFSYLLNDKAPDLSNLTMILIALGFGLAPYAVNKIANAVSDKDKTV